MTLALIMHLLKANAFMAFSSFLLACFMRMDLTPKSAARLYFLTSSLLLGLIAGTYILSHGLPPQHGRVAILVVVLFATTLVQAGLGAIHGCLHQAPAKA